MWVPPTDHPLRRLFSGLTEHTFITQLGVTDTDLIDYISVMLARFIHVSDIHCLNDDTGKPLASVSEMAAEAAKLPGDGRTAREIHRQIGDFTLFWTGVYPEALEKARQSHRRDCFVDYCATGKRSYYLASTYETDDLAAEARVLRKLSDEFELCAYGLNQVRREWRQYT